MSSEAYNPLRVVQLQLAEAAENSNLMIGFMKY